ncbi:unnamed protein product [Pieris macdunnoughi]|uniref:Drebrin-like protein n=1 Tax=Pieris macdunnoughi TaxID=345717 RepID=A0A821T0Q2_9NEOP|nr:unnamed protein product [Pieris macdunnoughi]
MAINLDKFKADLLAAWKDVLDEKSDTDWALFSYDGMSNDLKFISKGDGGLTELVDEFNSGKIQYAFLKVDIPNSTISKYVLINWQGEGAPTVRKGTCANHIKHVSQFFNGFHTTIHARTEDDLDEKIILDNLAKAGSAFNFKSNRNEEQPPSGPIGTSYQKVNPVQEINSKERDQFWLKEEQEEKKRVEAERKQREEEKRKAEEEVRKRDEREAAKRAQVEQQNIPQDKAPRTSVSERSVEARELIGASTSAARKMFQQNLAQGQIYNKSSNIPEKPVRSSVIAQRINAFSQNTSQPSSPIHTPKSPTQLEAKDNITPIEKSPTGKPPTPATEKLSIDKEEATDSLQEGQKSPLKNIDKITMSLETPSQIQYEPIIDPTDLSPSTENEPSSFSSVNYTEYLDYRDLKQCEPMIKQNILENDIFDPAYSSSNENDDDDSDNKFSTIKRSPYSKNNDAELSRQNTVIENVNYKKENGATHEDVSPEGLEESSIYEDLDDDPGLTARALYDYQAADESEITFDPGDIITHIEQIDAGWWQGLGPHGVFGLFPANYVELMPCVPR